MQGVVALATAPFSGFLIWLYKYNINWLLEYAHLSLYNVSSLSNKEMENAYAEENCADQ